MAAVYLDTSALGRVLLGEPDTRAIRAALAGFTARVSSRMLAVELRRLALRHEHDAGPLLGGVALIPVNEAILRAAEALLPSRLRTLDAIHLATMLATGDSAAPVTTIMTYERHLQEAAEEQGLAVIAPVA